MILALWGRTPDTLLARRFPGSEPQSILKQPGCGRPPLIEAKVAESRAGGFRDTKHPAGPEKEISPAPQPRPAAPHTMVLNKC